MEKLPTAQTNTSGNNDVRDLTSMVILGLEEDVVEYLASADKLTLQSALTKCLQLSIVHRRPGIMKRLIEAGATMEAEHIPFVFKSGVIEIMDLFLSHYHGYRSIDTSCATILLDVALMGGNQQFLQRTLSKLQELNIRMNNLEALFPLHEIINMSYRRCFDIVDQTWKVEEALGVFIQHGFEINGFDSKRETPLHVAARLGNVAGVKALIKLGANSLVKNSQGEYPWVTAWNCNHHNDTARELFEGMNLTDRSVILHEACRSMSVAAVKFLLHRGVDVNSTVGENRSPLITVLHRHDYPASLMQRTPRNVSRGAVRRTEHNQRVNGQEIASLLLQAGASVNLPDHSGHTLLMDSRLFGNWMSRDWLLQNGADVNAVAEDGLSVLWTAVSQAPINPARHSQQKSYVEGLLLRNIDMRVSQYKHQGMTPLLSAFKRHQHEACTLLLDADCSLRGMSEYLSSTHGQVLEEDMQTVRTRILEICDEPYSLKIQARLAVLGSIRQCDLKQALHRLYRTRLLPKALVNYLGNSIKFNVDSVRE